MAKASRRPDIATVGGLAIALAGILGGLVLEGGNPMQILQPTAAMIVAGGTLGAVMVTTPMSVLRRAALRLMAVFLERRADIDAVVEQLIGFATKARKTGIVSLEADAGAIEDGFLRKALTLAVDGTDLEEIRRMMELESAVHEQRAEAEAKVFEHAGGYAPTIGIIGAVLGLIQVMQHLENIEEVGRGIATAFVATIYGVGLANILLLPAASKIRARTHSELEFREAMLQGVMGVVEGLNPKLLRAKLEAFTRTEGKGKPAPAAKARRAA